MLKGFWALFYEKAWFYIKQYDQLYSFILYVLVLGIMTPAILSFTDYDFIILAFVWFIGLVLWVLLAVMGVKIFRR